MRARTTFKNSLLNLFRRQPGGVQIYRVGRLRERRLGAMAVAVVAFGNLRREFRGRHIGLLAGAAPDTLHGVRVEENLDAGVGKNDGTYVASLHNDVGVIRHALLFRYQRRADAAHGRHAGSGHRDLRGSNSVAYIFVVEQYFAQGKQFNLGRVRQLFQPVRVVEIGLLAQSPQRHRAIHGAAIDKYVTESLGEPARNGALARSGRAIDSDHVTHYRLEFNVTGMFNRLAPPGPVLNHATPLPFDRATARPIPA